MQACAARTMDAAFRAHIQLRARRFARDAKRIAVS
jgi:hypothetical protein